MKNTVHNLLLIKKNHVGLFMYQEKIDIMKKLIIIFVIELMKILRMNGNKNLLIKKIYEDEFLEKIDILCNGKFIYFNIFLHILFYLTIFF